MKTTIVIIITILLLSAQKTTAQYTINKFHYKNQLSIGGFYGLGIDSKQAEIQFQKLKNNDVGFNVFFHFEEESKKYTKLDFKYYNLGFNGFINILKNTKTKNYFLHISGGAYGGYEDLQSKIADDNKSKFIYGLKTGIDNEFYFAKKFIFSLQFNQYYSINSELGTFHWIGLAGLKYIIK